MNTSVSSRLSTETPLIQDMIADIKKGEVKIPQFQRKFVWKEEQAFDLLDSIANTYPIGSLLLWRTTVKLAAERNIGDFRLPDTDDMTPTNYVLDGQQRLTVIYSCIGAPDIEEGFAAAYDLQSQVFVQVPGHHNPLMFPLRWLYETTKMLNFRTALVTFPEGETYQRRLDALIHAFQNYRVPMVTLKDLSIEQVCPIFERINSSGTKLSIYDLMVAATWKQDFNLNDEVARIASSLDAKGFNAIDPNTILKCLAAVQYGGIKKDQVLSLRKLRKQEMEALVATTRDALLSTVDLLSTEFKIYSWEFLPYEALVIVLCYIFAMVKTLSDEKVKRVRQWFWRSSFSERYRVGGESFVSKDLLTIHGFVVNEAGDPKDFGSSPDADQWKRLMFRSNNSRSRAFILALALLGPHNITNGAKIDTAEALSYFNRKQFHHIYPRAYLKRCGLSQDENSIVNICMLAASENNRVSDSDPHGYLPLCVAGLKHDATKVFSSSLLPDPDVFDYASASYNAFLDERARLIAEYTASLCSGNVH